MTNFAWVMPSVVNVGVNATLAALGVLTVGLAVFTWIAGQTAATALLVWYVLRRTGGFGRPDASPRAPHSPVRESRATSVG